MTVAGLDAGHRGRIRSGVVRAAAATTAVPRPAAAGVATTAAAAVTVRRRATATTTESPTAGMRHRYAGHRHAVLPTATAGRCVLVVVRAIGTTDATDAAVHRRLKAAEPVLRGDRVLSLV